jgi:hypothetical protein
MMYRRSFATFATCALFALPTAALACERDPRFSFKLPGETEAQAQDRTNRIEADEEVVRHRRRETYNLKNATEVYLARVISQTPAKLSPGKWSGRSTVVRPLKALSGELKTQDRSLVDDGGLGLCDDRGDGYGAFADSGDFVVVFEGLPITTERPRGTDSLKVNDIRSEALLDNLSALYGPKYQ